MKDYGHRCGPGSYRCTRCQAEMPPTSYRWVKLTRAPGELTVNYCEPCMRLVRHEQAVGQVPA